MYIDRYVHTAALKVQYVPQVYAKYHESTTRIQLSEIGPHSEEDLLIRVSCCHKEGAEVTHIVITLMDDGPWYS